MQGFQTIEVNGEVFFEKAAMPGQSSHAGALEDRACFMFMLRGNSMTIEQTGSTTMNMTEGIIKRCSRYVSQFKANENDTFCEGVAVYFYPSFIKKIFRDEFSQFKQIPSPNFNTKKVVSNTLIQQYIEGLIPYFDVPELMDEQLAEIKIKELVQLLIHSENRQSILDFFSELFAEPTVLGMKEVVQNNLYSDLTMDQLAYLCNMSLATFKRAFRKHYHASPAAYIRAKRVEKAKHLLSSTSLQIQEIAFDCGFNELSSFSHTFHKIEGLSPSAYRMSQMHNSLSS